MTPRLAAALALLPGLAQILPDAATPSALVGEAHPPGEDLHVVFAKFAASIFIGLLVGLEREWAKATDKALFAGIRTFPFISLLGCVSAMIGSEHAGSWFFPASYIGFSLFVAANHFVVGGTPGHGLGTTTEITSMLVFLFGGLVYWGHPGLAAALTVIVTVILSIKQPLHDLAQRVESPDIYATLKLAVVSVIVLPLLPDAGLHIEGVPYIDVVNPQKIWLVVVLVSGVAFLGYVAAKVVGPGRGIVLTGILGGIVSSTAVTLAMSERSHEDERLAPKLALASILATTVLFFRTIVDVAIVFVPLAIDLVGPLIGASLFGIAASTYLWFRGARTSTEGLTLKNPFSLMSAVKFGLLFAATLVLSAYMSARFDRAGVFVAAVIGGLVGTRPTALSVASLASQHRIQPHDAVAAVMLGALSNTMLQFIWTEVNGARVFRRMLLPAFVLVIVGGAIATGFVIAYGANWFG
jgi:uncharacterized membrane protein (DUF4010 family)